MYKVGYDQLIPSWTNLEQVERFEWASIDEALEEIKLIVKNNFRLCELAIIEEAFNLISQEYGFCQDRYSNRLKIRHLLATARTTAEHGFNPQSVAAALLHDIIEDTQITIEQIEKRFGKQIARLISTISNELAIFISNQSEARLQQELLNRVLQLIGDNIKNLPAVFIKMAERLDQMHFLVENLPLKQQASITQETMYVYAPLAEVLGTWRLKGQLEDLSFKFQNPKTFNQIVNELKTQQPISTLLLQKMVNRVVEELKESRGNARVISRVKHVYSVYKKKMKRGGCLGNVYDLLGMRIIVDDLYECYEVLDLIHQIWKPLEEEFNDYIRFPKPNGYQSLHTTVIFENYFVEIQIRTSEMDEVDEFGLAAHWRYKENGDTSDNILLTKISALIQEFESARRNQELISFWDEITNKFFQEKIHVYSTTNGRLFTLPKESTPIDLASAMGIENGRRCIGARVGNLAVPSNWCLQTGDLVQILIN